MATPVEKLPALQVDSIWNRVHAVQGMAIVRLLKQIEHRTQRNINELFDLVCGTSTGGILAVALALKGMSLEQCSEIYR